MKKKENKNLYFIIKKYLELMIETIDIHLKKKKDKCLKLCYHYIQQILSFEFLRKTSDGEIEFNDKLIEKLKVVFNLL